MKHWRESTEAQAKASLAKFRATLPPELREIDHEKRRRMLDKRRAALKVSKVVPLEAIRAYDTYSVSNHTKGKKFLLQLLGSPKLATLWAGLEKQRIDFYYFCLAFIERAENHSHDLVSWHTKPHKERKAFSLELAETARALAQAIDRSPAQGYSLPEFIQESLLERAADHCVLHPFQEIYSAPCSAAHAIEKAIPPLGTLPDALRQLATMADGWAKFKPRYGKNDRTLKARKLVADLAFDLSQSTSTHLKNEMLHLIRECVNILTDIDFELRELRSYAKAGAV